MQIRINKEIDRIRPQKDSKGEEIIRRPAGDNWF
jgi:hypothetical protein